MYSVKKKKDNKVVYEDNYQRILVRPAYEEYVTNYFKRIYLE